MLPLSNANYLRRRKQDREDRRRTLPPDQSPVAAPALEIRDPPHGETTFHHMRLVDFYNPRLIFTRLPPSAIGGGHDQALNLAWETSLCQFGEHELVGWTVCRAIYKSDPPEGYQPRPPTPVGRGVDARAIILHTSCRSLEPVSQPIPQVLTSDGSELLISPWEDDRHSPLSPLGQIADDQLEARHRFADARDMLLGGGRASSSSQVQVGTALPGVSLPMTLLAEGSYTTRLVRDEATVFWLHSQAYAQNIPPPTDPASARLAAAKTSMRHLAATLPDHVKELHVMDSLPGAASLTLEWQVFLRDDLAFVRDDPLGNGPPNLTVHVSPDGSALKLENETHPLNLSCPEAIAAARHRFRDCLMDLETARAGIAEGDQDIPIDKSEVLPFLNSLSGPDDAWRAEEDRLAALGLPLDPELLLRLGFSADTRRSFLGGAQFQLIDAVSCTKRRLHTSQQQLEDWRCGKDLYLCRKEDYGSARLYIDEAWGELTKLFMLNRAVLYRSPTEIPPDLNICPGQILPGLKKNRYISDLSVTGINEVTELVLVDYGNIFRFCRLLSFRALMWGADLKDCFWNWLIHPANRRWFGMNVPDSLLKACYLFCPQGFKSSPGVNDTGIKTINHKAEDLWFECKTVDFVDDIRGTSASNRADLLHVLTVMEFWRTILKELGLPLHEFNARRLDKLIYPTTSCPWIGFLFDTVLMLLFLDAPNLARYMKSLEAFLDAARHEDCAQRRITARDLASLIGQLVHATEVATAGRLYLSNMYRLLNSSGAPQRWCDGDKRCNPDISLDLDACADTNSASQRTLLTNVLLDADWWLDVLRAGPRRPIHQLTDKSETFLLHPGIFKDKALLAKIFQDTDLVAVVRSDACGFGWGLTCDGISYQGLFHPNWRPPHKNSNFRELAALYLWLRDHYIPQTALRLRDTDLSRAVLLPASSSQGLGSGESLLGTPPSPTSSTPSPTNGAPDLDDADHPERISSHIMLPGDPGPTVTGSSSSAPSSARAAPKRIVLYYSDNTTTVHYVNVGVGRIPELTQLARLIKKMLVKNGIDLCADHLAGRKNTTSDLLSRYKTIVQGFDKLEERGMKRTSLMRFLRAHRLPWITADMMASRTLNLHTEYWNKRRDGFTAGDLFLDSNVTFWHPPDHLAKGVLKDVLRPLCVRHPEVATRPVAYVVLPPGINAVNHMGKRTYDTSFLWLLQKFNASDHFVVEEPACPDVDEAFQDPALLPYPGEAVYTLWCTVPSRR